MQIICTPVTFDFLKKTIFLILNRHCKDYSLWASCQISWTVSSSKSTRTFITEYNICAVVIIKNCTA